MYPKPCDMLKILDSIPRPIPTTAFLSYGGRDSLDTDSIVHSIRAMRHTTLDLSDCVRHLSPEELSKVTRAIPFSVTSLNLCSNSLAQSKWTFNRDRIPEELVRVLKGIPASVTSLNLSWNDFFLFTGEELAKVFAAIPISVTSLDLSGNYLESVKDISVALAAIPASVTCLSLNNFFSAPEYIEESILQLFANVPATIKEVKARNFPPKFTEKIKCQLDLRKAKGLLTRYFKFEKIDLANPYEMALNILLEIPRELPYFAEAGRLLWQELYGILVTQKEQASTTVFAAAATGAESAMVKWASQPRLADVIEYATAAGEGSKLLKLLFPGINIVGNHIVDSVSKFMADYAYAVIHGAEKQDYRDITIEAAASSTSDASPSFP